MQIKEIVQHLEKIAPPNYQESYDNSGLLVGHRDTMVSGVLITLDVTEAVIDEAIASDSNLIVAHHPLIFADIKKLNGNHWVEKCVIKAIKNDVAIYAIHTNLDNVRKGVNAKFAEKLGLTNTQILSPKMGLLTKLTTFVPKAYATQVLEALYAAGAGEIGKYDRCSFSLTGEGTYRPSTGANAFRGEIGQDEHAEELRIEVLLPSFKSRFIIEVMQEAHPYEEVAYYLSKLENEHQEIGSGMIGELAKPMDAMEFLLSLKTKMNTAMVRHTALVKNKVHKVALCGGAGSFLLAKAKAAGADIFITGDFKYHEFFEAENALIIADIGHYESEQFTKDLLYDILTEKFTNIALRLSEVETNPIKYL